MEWRTKFGALLGAAGLVMLAAATVVAAPPTYSISVTKTASPSAVPPSGGSVLYTISVTPTGTGFFNSVVVDDGMAGCTVAGPTGDDDADGKMEPGETWSYTCTVNGVMPGAQNTATVNACHDQSECVSSHDATDNDSVTVGEGSEPPSQPPSQAPSDPPSDPPSQAPSDPPGSQDPGSFTPTQDVGDATEPATDTIVGSNVATGADDRAWLLVVALGLLLGSVVVLTPARPVRTVRQGR